VYIHAARKRTNKHATIDTRGAQAHQMGAHVKQQTTIATTATTIATATTATQTTGA
jgi:hypothetical protein